jgi:hypothetical protein
MNFRGTHACAVLEATQQGVVCATCCACHGKRCAIISVCHRTVAEYSGVKVESQPLQMLHEVRPVSKTSELLGPEAYQTLRIEIGNTKGLHHELCCNIVSTVVSIITAETKARAAHRCKGCKGVYRSWVRLQTRVGVAPIGVPQTPTPV